MKKIIFLITAVLLFNFVLAQSVIAIGQLTKPIVIENILRGQEVAQTLKLFNSENKEVIYQLKADGKISSWATFYKIDDKNFENPIAEINIPAESQVQAFVKFKVPEDAANGTYSGQVVVISGDSGQESQQGSVNVLETIGRSVLITVTDKEIIDLEASIIPSKYGIRQGDPLKIKIDYYNKGNVFMKPDVQLTIKKDGNTVFNAIFTYPESEEPIKIRERKTLSYVEWSTSGQENGGYRAEVKILHNGQVVLEDDFKFSIGYFQGAAWISAVSFLGFGNMTFGWLVVGVLIIILGAVLNAINKKTDYLKNLIKKLNIF